MDVRAHQCRRIARRLHRLRNRDVFVTERLYDHLIAGISCADVIANLPAYVNRTLDREDHERFEQVFHHLKKCRLLEWWDHSNVHLLYGLDGFGYAWVFPKQEYVNLGILGFLSQKQDRNMRVIYEKFVRTLKAQGKISPSFEMTNLQGGIIPIKGVIPKTQTDRVLLCGDAAGFVNGVTGEGIYYAMVSGDLAAKTLVQAFQQNDFSESTLTYYQTAWKEEIGGEIAQSIHVQRKLLANLHFIDILVKMLAKHEGMKKMFTDYFMGKTTYSKLKWYLMLHFPPQYLKLQAMKILR